MLADDAVSDMDIDAKDLTSDRHACTSYWLFV